MLYFFKFYLEYILAVTLNKDSRKHLRAFPKEDRWAQGSWELEGFLTFG